MTSPASLTGNSARRSTGWRSALSTWDKAARFVMLQLPSWHEFIFSFFALQRWVQSLCCSSRATALLK